MMVWDSETIRLLRQLWAEGHSTNEIARRLNCSKNAVVGKAHRLDLDARPSPIHRDGPTKTPLRPIPPCASFTLPPLASEIDATMAVAARPIPAPRGKPARAKPTIIPPQPPAAPVYRKPSVSCCWPVGEPGTKAFRFCDALSIPGKPYCDEHARLAYVRVRDSEDRRTAVPISPT